MVFFSQMGAEPQGEEGQCGTSPNCPAGTSGAVNENLGGNGGGEAGQPSHYLYVPNNTGIFIHVCNTVNCTVTGQI